MERNRGERLVDLYSVEFIDQVEKMVERVFDRRLPKAPTKYYSVLQVSEILQISRVSIYRLVAEEKFPYCRPNGLKRIRFSQQNIDDFLLKNPGFVDRHGFASK
jgi:excisionase family DNA binding protein